MLRWKLFLIKGTSASFRRCWIKQKMRNSAAYARRYKVYFDAEYGSFLCAEMQKKLLGRSFKLYIPEDYKLFDEMGGHERVCPDVVGKAGVWLAELIEKIEEERARER